PEKYQLENWQKVRESHLQISPSTLTTGLEDLIPQTDNSTQKTLESSRQKVALFRQTNFSDKFQLENWQKFRESHLQISPSTLTTGLEDLIPQTDSSTQKTLKSSRQKVALFRQTNFSDKSQLENWQKVRESHLQISPSTLATDLEDLIPHTDSSPRKTLKSSRQKVALFRQTNFSDKFQLENWQKFRENHLQISPSTLANDLEDSIPQTDSSTRKTLESSLEKATLFRKTNPPDKTKQENWGKLKLGESHLQIYSSVLATSLEDSIPQTDSSPSKTLESSLEKTTLFRQTNFPEKSQLENWRKVRESHLQISSSILTTYLEDSILQMDSYSRKNQESSQEKSILFRPTNFSEKSPLENWQKVRENHLKISPLTLATALEDSILQMDSYSRKNQESSQEKSILFRPTNFSEKSPLENWGKVRENNLQISSSVLTTYLKNSILQTDSSPRKTLESSLEKTTLFRQTNFSDKTKQENWEKFDREIYEKTDLQDARLVYVVSVEEAGEAECFDLEMEDQSSPYFLAQGIVVHNCYQEQIMKMAQDLAGYSLGEADLLRRCLSGSTKVIDAATGNLVSLKEIAAKPEYWLGRKVFSLDTKSQQIVQQPITEIHPNGTRGVWEITTRTNRKIRATNDHLFYTVLGWKPLEDFSVGDRLGLAKEIPINHSSEISDAQIKFTAYLIGDEYLSTKSPASSYFCIEEGRRKKEEGRRKDRSWKKWMGTQTPTNFNEVKSQKSEVRSDFCNGDLSKAPKIFRFKRRDVRPNYFDKHRVDGRVLNPKEKDNHLKSADSRVEEGRRKKEEGRRKKLKKEEGRVGKEVRTGWAS
ncbi:MAG: hypothetical protein F6K39_14925, partial [Okeania sp. SIO3B3]|nr:hypothetical protein [Okeania sp. SIO3B3]